MKRTFLLMLLVFSAIVTTAPVLADGDFYVIAGGGGVGTKITNLPKIISQSGFYCLNGNLTTSGDGIIIDANEVTLDLMGFSITGSSPGDGTGISITTGKKNVEVRNGNLNKFFYGIKSEYTNSRNHRFINLKVTSCGSGIIGDADATIITGCIVSDCGTGIHSMSRGSIISNNIVSYNFGTGIYLYSNDQNHVPSGVITNNSAYNNYYGFYLNNNAAQLLDRNTSTGNTTANWYNWDACTKGLNSP
jgi:parallel beta-helix repeat protein